MVSTKTVYAQSTQWVLCFLGLYVETWAKDLHAAKIKFSSLKHVPF